MLNESVNEKRGHICLCLPQSFRPSTAKPLHTSSMGKGIVAEFWTLIHGSSTRHIGVRKADMLERCAPSHTAT